MSMAVTRSTDPTGADVSTCDTHPVSSFGTLLKAYRASRRVSQYRLAKMIGVTHSAVSRWESGGRHPEPENVASVTAALDLGDDDRTALHRAAGYDLDVERFRAYPPDVRRALVTIGDMMTRAGAA